MAPRPTGSRAILLLGPLLCLAQAPPPLPACLPFSTTGGVPVACNVTLTQGWTYTLYTECDSVKGDTQLHLFDPRGAPVAFNDGFPFCPGDASASLLEYQMPCNMYGVSAPFILEQGCYEDTPCSGRVVISLDGKEPPLQCEGAPPPAPPARGPFSCTKQDATCEALGDLYYSTGGQFWDQTAGWNRAADGLKGPQDYCTFENTHCVNSSMVQLTMPGNSLAGPLPLSFGQLTTLTRIILDHNALSSTLPESIGSLTSLMYLYVENNSLSGSIPSSIGALRNITTLNFSANAMTGTVPSSIGSLTRLVNFALADNKLSGSLPASFASLTALNGERLLLANSGLCGVVPGTVQPFDGPLPPCAKA